MQHIISNCQPSNDMQTLIITTESVFVRAAASSEKHPAQFAKARCQLTLAVQMDNLWLDGWQSMGSEFLPILRSRRDIMNAHPTVPQPTLAAMAGVRKPEREFPPISRLP
jgi:hypothetical protein